MIADPLFTVPLRVVNLDSQGLTPDVSLCYEVHGQANAYFNLISDSCVSVNAHYTAVSHLHVINQVAIRAVDETNTCHNILINTNDTCSAFVDGVSVNSFVTAGVSVRKFTERVRVSVPNCAKIKLVMWMFCQTDSLGMNKEARLIKFVVARGFNLQPTSHGILGLLIKFPIHKKISEVLGEGLRY